jgi:hypothetical protein
LPLWTAGGMGASIWQGRELVLNSGRNVGVGLTRFLDWCGVKHILLTGQDFAWSDGRTHAKGHVAENSGGKAEFNPKVHIKLRNRSGDEIYSHHIYHTALRTLEKEINSMSIPVYNLYGDLAVIQGARDVTPEEILADRLLESAPGSLDHFLWKVHQGRSPRPWPIFEARSTNWSVSLNTARKRLEKLFKKAHNHQNEIRGTINQLIIFLSQDPFYKPYLIIQSRDLAGLLFVNRRFGKKELAKCKTIMKTALQKVREIDRALVVGPEAQTRMSA